MKDRVRIMDDGTLDEVMMTGAYVHLEHLGDGAYMLIVENKREHVHLTLHCRTDRAGVPRAFVFERYDR